MPTVLLALLLLAPLLLGRCAHKETPPANDKAQAMVRSAVGNLGRDAGTPHAALGWVAADGGAPLGLQVTSSVDAPMGLHVRLLLQDGDGGVLASGKLVGLCVPAAQQGVPVLVPLDSSLSPEDLALLSRLPNVTATQVDAAPGCLRPVVHMDVLATPR